MKRVDEPDTILLYDGKLARVVGIAEGRTIILQFLDEQPCPTCGSEPRMHALEHSPMFQDHVQPVPTLTNES